MSLVSEPHSAAATDRAIPSNDTAFSPLVSAAHREACQRVREMTYEAYAEIAGRDTLRRNNRHAMQHIRQIALYVCHVTLSLPVAELAACFGRDRSSISIACQRVEDLRDDEGYDAFVTSVEEQAKPLLAMLRGGVDE